MPSATLPIRHRRLLLIMLAVLALHALLLAAVLPWLDVGGEQLLRSVEVALTAHKAVTDSQAPTEQQRPDADTSPVEPQTAATPDPQQPALLRKTHPAAVSSPPAPSPVASRQTSSSEPMADAPVKPDAQLTAPAAQTTPDVNTEWEQGYLQRLRSALERTKRYPPMARRFGEEGKAVLQFRIDRDGRLRQAKLIEGSGSERLDQAALQTIERLARFDPLPPQHAGDSLTVSVPLIYRLD